MSLFQFVIKNADVLEQIYANHKGEINVEIDEFDFSHNDVHVDVDGSHLVFSVEAGALKLMTTIDVDNLADAVKHVQKISNIDLRVTVLETIEEQYRKSAEETVDRRKMQLEEAKDEYDVAKKDFDLVVDAITDLKGSWNIP